MNLQVIALGQKLPAWMETACSEYARRLPGKILSISAIATPQRRSGHSVERLKQQEAEKIQAKIKPGSYTIALDEHGRQWSTAEWAQQLRDWKQFHPQVNFIIGGPDGLDEELQKSCQQVIALGKMTLPHGLARIVLIEQLYRAWSVVEGHPYHRE
jgi:23S rRNA (pseudouridine1915-N3)-methyltransferase